MNTIPPGGGGRVPKTAEILLKAKIIDEFQLKSGMRELGKWGGRFTRIVGEMKFAPEQKVVDAIAQALKLPPINLEQVPADKAALAKVDAALCEEKGLFPCALKDQGKTLWLAMADPTDFETVSSLEQRLRVRMKLMVAGEVGIKTAIAKHYKGITDARTINTAGAMMASHAGAGALEFEQVPGGATGEFMDAGGEVVGKMRHNTDPRARMPVPPGPSQSALGQVASAVAGAHQSVSDELDHLFGMAPGGPAWSPEDLQRLEAARANQDKGAKVFRAVIELCVEKGLLSPADAGRLKF